tara:strand:- start:233 stop:445 length:213 start_codon:yes stop_codon:yes gene_type:complete
MTGSIRFNVDIKDYCKPCRGSGVDYSREVNWGKSKQKIAVDCVKCGGKGYTWTSEKIDTEQLKELLDHER